MQAMHLTLPTTAPLAQLVPQVSSRLLQAIRHALLVPKMMSPVVVELCLGRRYLKYLKKSEAESEGQSLQLPWLTTSIPDISRQTYLTRRKIRQRSI